MQPIIVGVRGREKEATQDGSRLNGVRGRAEQRVDWRKRGKERGRRSTEYF
jgi:hypothetical protein